MPINVKGALKFAHQAQFHPRKFLLGLADEFIKEGGVIYENTEATDITIGKPHTVITKQGELSAKHVV